jgi:hypothetical protein
MTTLMSRTFLLGVVVFATLLMQQSHACHREFIKYYPSKFEQEWVDNIEEWQTDICPRIKSPTQAKKFSAWLNMADAVAMENENHAYVNTTTAKCTARLTLESQNLDIFSKMEYRFNCPKMAHDLHGVVFNETIEPLVGFLRDSSPVCYGKQKRTRNGRVVGLEDKNYIVFSDLKCTTQRLRQQQQQQQQQQAMSGDSTSIITSGSGSGEEEEEGGGKREGQRERQRQRALSPRLFIIDLGATLYFWSLSGPSQQYLLQKYSRSGYTNLYRLMAFEANYYQNQKKIFAGIPPAVIPHYQYFNVPITSEVGSKYNPLTLLRALAKPRDFVSVKLDVDNSDIEFGLIAQILSDPGVHSLIDEFFFEHHSTVKEFQWAWKEQVRGSLADGYKFFRQMRELGIRAHSWI